MILHHIAVVCSCVENADRFYQDLLGLDKQKDTTIGSDLAHQIFDIADECRLLFYSNSDVSVEVFIPSDSRNQALSFQHACLSVTDKESLVDRCRKIGSDVNLIPRGDYALTFIRDFDGNLFEIKEIEG